MENISIRKYAKNHGVYLWEIAMFLNVSEMTITRKLRKELSETESEEIKKVIDQIAEQKKTEI